MRFAVESRRIRVAQIGLGPIGQAIVRRLAGCTALQLVSAVDPREDLVARELDAIVGEVGAGLRVDGDLAALCGAEPPEVALHATGSHLPDVAEQFRVLTRAGVSVVSTCEELSYPFYRHPRLSRELDDLAREQGTVLLGTGVNPGFLMDKLVVTMLSVCDTARHVRVRRIVDARTRRESFQRKIGAGITPEEFVRRRDGVGLGHVGLAESAHMVADAMGVSADRSIVERVDPVVAERAVESEFLRVEAGQVAGIDQEVSIDSADARRVTMELRMFLGAEQPIDELSVDGAPPVRFEAPDGVPGDSATAALVVACAPLVGGLRPGLRTMLDVPLQPALQPWEDGS